jgi:molybdopterin-guanine dinucleotide biosynthesis protein A
MPIAGLLLTGGRSLRMGTDKAALPARWTSSDNPAPGGLRLAERTARLLESVTAIAVEVGPGFSHLPHVWESPQGSGPLSALVCGSIELRARGFHGPVLVVATDLPRLTSGMLDWLAHHQPGRSVVPVAGGRTQPLCARYEPDDLALASRLVASGSQAMTALIEAAQPLLVGEEDWINFAGDPACLADLDTPEHLDAFRKGLR